jgi:hypothetical protein
MAMQGAVSAAFYVPCMGIPGMFFAVVAILAELLGIYASVMTILQVQGALELTITNAEVDEVIYLANEVAPTVVSNMSMALGIIGSSGILAGVFGLYTFGLTEQLVAFAKARKSMAVKKKPQRKKKKRRN